MLRHPSEWFSKLREEGCSSTAIDGRDKVRVTVWNNLAGRGSDHRRLVGEPAVS
ncbi:MAG: hypothetical protein L0241_23175 [Planctomycetia bacterium]|nr:hypothetical protein [Planctomycetia bacterium]